MDSIHHVQTVVDISAIKLSELNHVDACRGFPTELSTRGWPCCIVRILEECTSRSNCFFASNVLRQVLPVLALVSWVGGNICNPVFCTCFLSVREGHVPLGRGNIWPGPNKVLLFYSRFIFTWGKNNFFSTQWLCNNFIISDVSILKRCSKTKNFLFEWNNVRSVLHHWTGYMSSFFFSDPHFFFCWREGRFSAKKLTRNKELTCDGLSASLPPCIFKKVFHPPVSF